MFRTIMSDLSADRRHTITSTDIPRSDLRHTVHRAGTLLSLLMVLLVLTFAVQQYRTISDRVLSDARRSAHIVATQFQWVLQTSSQTLQRIEDAIGDPAAQHDGIEIANIGAAIRALPAGLYYGVYDAAGQLRYSSLSGPPHINIADRPYFAALRGGQELAITPQIMDRQSGQRVFVVARRLNHGTEFRGVATIAIPQSTLEKLAESLDQDGMPVVALIRTDGMLIARTPPIEPRDYRGTPLFENLAREPRGAFVAVSNVDGVRRVIGYWTLEDWPVVATAAISQTAAYSDLMRGWALGALFGSPFLILFMLFLHRLNLQAAREEAQNIALAEANAHAQFLLREIHHRVKNNLQSVISLIRLERVPAEVKSRLLSRIATMIELHEEIYKSDQPEWISLRAYVPRLINRIAAGHAERPRLQVKVDPLVLPGERAMVLGLLLNELITNAYKHAFPGNDDPELRVHVTTGAPGWIRLTVCDNGQGIAIEEADKGMGTQLITAFTEQLGGRLALANNVGLCVTVDFPENPGR